MTKCFASSCVGGAREERGSPPEVVAEVIHHALTAKRPRLRYPVGADSSILITLPRVLPDRALDQVRLRMLGMPTAFGCESATVVPGPTKGETANVADG